MSQAPTQRRKLAAILMADVSGFSALMGRDEERATELIREFHRRVRRTVEEHEGRVVDTAGDSVFGEFASVVNAVRCARTLQQNQAERNAAEPAERHVWTRIGIHLGDVIVEGDRVYGDGVNIAARLEQLAEPGGILVSEAVYQQVHNKLELGFADQGARELKNISHPVRLYRLLEREPPGVRLETRPSPPAVAPRTESAALPQPLQVEAQVSRVRSLEAWVGEILKAGILVPVVIAILLLLSGPFIPSGGTLPTAGAIFLGAMLGGVWSRLTGQRGNRTVGMGLGVFAGAFLTGWSQLTNFLFACGGLAVIASGIGMNFRPPRSPPARELRRRARRRSPRHRAARPQRSKR